MPTATAECTDDPVVRLVREDPARIMSLAGMEPDPWQADLLRSDRKRIIMLCNRRSGKSQSAAALALKTVLLSDKPVNVVIVAPGQFQAQELLRLAQRLYRDLYSQPMGTDGAPLVSAYAADLAELKQETQWKKKKIKEAAKRMELPNGSRILAVPGKASNIVGLTAHLLIIDEAARVPDALWADISPFVGTTQGIIVVLSSPYGRRGWFYREWHCMGPDGEPIADDWEGGRVEKTWHDCPRLTEKFLASEKARHGKRWFSQNYENSFLSVEGALFDPDDIDAADDPDAEFLKLEVL